MNEFYFLYKLMLSGMILYFIVYGVLLWMGVGCPESIFNPAYKIHGE